MKPSRIAPAVARYLLGLSFAVFGANFFLHFLPQPPPSGPSGDFAVALINSGYVMQVVKSIEVVAGLLLLFNRFVPLALTLLAPIVVGIVGFHLSLAPAAGVPAYLVLVLEIFLAYSYRDAFAPLFEAHVEPLAATSQQRATLSHSTT